MTESKFINISVHRLTFYRQHDQLSEYLRSLRFVYETAVAKKVRINFYLICAILIRCTVASLQTPPPLDIHSIKAKKLKLSKHSHVGCLSRGLGRERKDLKTVFDFNKWFLRKL